MRRILFNVDWLRAGVAAGVLALAAMAAAQTKPAETDFQRAQRQARESQSLAYRNVKTLPGEYALRDFCTLRIVDGRLSLDVHPPATLPVNTPRNTRVNIRGMGDFSLLMVLRNGRETAFSFNNINLSDPRALQIDTRIEYNESQLTIARSIQQEVGGAQFVSITLTQGTPEMAMADGDPFSSGVRLYVNSNSPQGSKVDVEIGEPDFASLRRNHPEEMRKYVRPLFRELRFDDVFDVDLSAARQVFIADWPADPAVAAKVAKLMAALDDDSFRRREAAMRELEATGPEGVLAALALDRSKLTPEQSAQLDSFLADRPGVAPAEAQRMRTDNEFLLDCLMSDEPMLRKVALGRLERNVGRKLDFDLLAAGERRQNAVAALRAALTPAATQPSGREN